MKIFSLSILFFISLPSFGQPARKTVKAKSRYLLEQYEVLASNDTLRTGSYRRYFREGDVLLEEGQYENNQRTGIWTFYDGTGKPELVYDYSSKRVLANNRIKIDSTGIIDQEGQRMAVRLIPPPTCLVSLYQVTGILVRESRLPAHLQRAGVSELTYQIVVTVSSAGAHYRVITSHTDNEFSRNARESALLAFKDVQWLPGSYQGREVTSIYALPVVSLHGFSVVR